MTTIRLLAPAALALTLTVLSGCADPVERAYQDCLERIEEGLAKAQAEAEGPGADMAKAMADMARSAGAATCGAMREACRVDQNGPLCKAAMEGLAEP